MLLYRYLLHYGLLLHVMSRYLWLFSLILQGLHEEGECRQLEFWPGKGEKLRYLLCATPNAIKINEDLKMLQGSNSRVIWLKFEDYKVQTDIRNEILLISCKRSR